MLVGAGMGGWAAPDRAEFVLGPEAAGTWCALRCITRDAVKPWGK